MVEVMRTATRLSTLQEPEDPDVAAKFHLPSISLVQLSPTKKITQYNNFHTVR